MGLDHVGLAERVRGGDRDAWSAVYLDAYPGLVAFARRRLGRDDAARDAVSETMARAVAGIGGYRGGDDGVRPWLFGICRHVVADAQRRTFRAVPPPALAHEPEVDGPAELVAAAEERTAVRKAFARLDPDERELLELRIVAGLSSGEVAAMLGKQAGAVRMAQKRALDKLRIFMEEATRV